MVKPHEGFIAPKLHGGLFNALKNGLFSEDYMMDAVY
jgi:hypothetical protein